MQCNEFKHNKRVSKSQTNPILLTMIFFIKETPLKHQLFNQSRQTLTICWLDAKYIFHHKNSKMSSGKILIKGGMKIDQRILYKVIIGKSNVWLVKKLHLE